MSKPPKKKPVKAPAGTPPTKRGRQLPARVDDNLWQLLEDCAKGERRKVAPMVVILLEEALRARGFAVKPAGSPPQP